MDKSCEEISCNGTSEVRALLTRSSWRPGGVEVRRRFLVAVAAAAMATGAWARSLEVPDESHGTRPQGREQNATPSGIRQEIFTTEGGTVPSRVASLDSTTSVDTAARAPKPDNPSRPAVAKVPKRKDMTSIRTLLQRAPSDPGALRVIEANWPSSLGRLLVHATDRSFAERVASRMINADELLRIAESAAGGMVVEVAKDRLLHGSETGGLIGVSDKFWRDIVVRSRHDDLRTAAIERIRERTILGQLCGVLEPPAPREAACERAGSIYPAPLPRLDSKDVLDRMEAIRWLADQEMLASLALSGSREGGLAVSYIWDLHILARLAMNAPDFSVRSDATSHIHDQALLERIALTDPFFGVRRVAVVRVLDESVVAKVATSDPEASVRDVAVHLLDRQDLLASIAQNDAIDGVRSSATERLTDPEVLARLATEDPSWSVREDAVNRIEDEDLLVRVALEDRSSAVARRAFSRLVSVEALVRVATGSPHETVREEAVEKLRGHYDLAEIAENDPAIRVRVAATEAVHDPGFLAKAALTRPTQSERLTALRRVEDQAILQSIALSASDPIVRLEASFRIQDPAIIEEVALGDPDDGVREAWGTRRVRVRGRLVNEAGFPVAGIRLWFQSAVKLFNLGGDQLGGPTRVTGRDGEFDVQVPVGDAEVIHIVHVTDEKGGSRYLHFAPKVPAKFSVVGMNEVDIGDVVFRKPSR